MSDEKTFVSDDALLEQYYRLDEERKALTSRMKYIREKMLERMGDEDVLISENFHAKIIRYTQRRLWSKDQFLAENVTEEDPEGQTWFKSHSKDCPSTKFKVSPVKLAP